MTHQTIVRQRYTTADFDVNLLADYWEAPAVIFSNYSYDKQVAYWNCFYSSLNRSPLLRLVVFISEEHSFQARVLYGNTNFACLFLARLFFNRVHRALLCCWVFRLKRGNKQNFCSAFEQSCYLLYDRATATQISQLFEKGSFLDGFRNRGTESSFERPTSVQDLNRMNTSFLLNE